jgi:RNA-directed DNA polymerase
MHSIPTVARALAQATLQGAWRRDLLLARCSAVLGRQYKFLPGLIDRLWPMFLDARPDCDQVTKRIILDSEFRKSFKRSRFVIRASSQPAELVPDTWQARGWGLPAIGGEAELAEWLEMSHQQLAWFVDRRGWNRKSSMGPLTHYQYRWVPRRSGGRARLLETPKWRLKAAQRRILREILNRIPAHLAAHGFRPGCSVVSAVQPHVGRGFLLRMDLKDFFPTVRAKRVTQIFRSVGYSDSVASALSGICTHLTPRDVIDREPSGVDKTISEFPCELLRRRHLPQGAPTSPALANLAAHRLDCRLYGLATAAGIQYTRYADDLLFSGDDWSAARCGRLEEFVTQIIVECGFQVAAAKTRCASPASRQTALGLVLNDRLGISRNKFDQLKAILHNCVKSGAETQFDGDLSEFRLSLAGKVAYVESINENQGRKLRAKFEQIDWKTH